LTICKDVLLLQNVYCYGNEQNAINSSPDTTQRRVAWHYGLQSTALAESGGWS
jgi:hypothetical protein